MNHATRVNEQLKQNAEDESLPEDLRERNRRRLEERREGEHGD
jgi:hypothetical protein